MSDNYSFETALNFLRQNKRILSKKFGVKKTGIFGSFVRGEERQGSDIDILVEFEGGSETFKNYMHFKFFLEDAFSRKVDLVIIDDIKPVIKEGILREAVYA